MSGIFDEKNMEQILGKYCPAGETLKAGVHGIGLEVSILQIFKDCVYDGEEFMPAENGKTFRINKSKVARFDVYIGITENHLLLSQCEANRWLYEVEEIQDSSSNAAEKINGCLLLQDIGTCFPLADIQSCVIKKSGWAQSTVQLC